LLVKQPIRLIFGLGNPGIEYEHSPHNLGFAVVDRLALRHGVKLASRRSHSLCGHFLAGSEKIWLIQPQTFMNLSGVAVQEWLKKEECGPEALLIVHDELDLPWGKVQIRQRGGSAGHHGVESVMDSIDATEFVRVRIGVAPEHPLEDPVSYLLAPMRRSQRDAAEEFIDHAADAVEMILKEGAAKAMNRFNRREQQAGGEPGA
jgi:PTH1 family peptidyl-tRNA hydrolase